MGNPERKAETRHMYIHNHGYHGHYRESGKKFKTWSFGAKHLCPLLPVLRLLYYYEDFGELILQNAMQWVTLSDSCSQYLFSWTALHILSSKFKPLILINTELIRIFLFSDFLFTFHLYRLNVCISTGAYSAYHKPE